MERKYQIIFIWSFIIISGIVLLLLYTPLGGNLHYAATGDEYRYYVAPGVNYQTQVGSFSSNINTRKDKELISQNYIPQMSTGLGSDEFNHLSSSTNSSLNSSYNNYKSVNQVSKSTQGVGIGAGSVVGANVLAGGSRSISSSVVKANEANNGGGMPFSSYNNSVMQKATDGTDGTDDTADPGGDPNGPPLPLNDELAVMLVLISFFTFYKWLGSQKK